MGIYLLFRRSEWKSGLKLCISRLAFFPQPGNGANKKRPRPQPRAMRSTAIPPCFAASLRKAARCRNGHTRSGLTRRAQPDGSGAMFAGAAVSAFTLPDSLVTEAAPGTLPIYAIDT